MPLSVCVCIWFHALSVALAAAAAAATVICSSPYLPVYQIPSLLPQQIQFPTVILKNRVRFAERTPDFCSSLNLTDLFGQYLALQPGIFSARFS